MKYTNEFNGHQGDVQFFSIDKLPEKLNKISKNFFAKSEKSGHCHALCGDYDLYEDEYGFVVDVKENGATLNHTSINNLTKEYWDINKVLPEADHAPSIFKKGIYRIGIQVRKRPFSKIWEKVLD
jgi:hypothetical protein